MSVCVQQSHKTCVLCAYWEKLKGLPRLKRESFEKFAEVRVWEAHSGFPTLQHGARDRALDSWSYRVFELAPIDSIISSLKKPKDSLAWFGVSSFSHFYDTVQPYLIPYRTRPPIPEYCQLQRTLLLLKQGFPMRVAAPLLEPIRDTSTLKSVFLHTLEHLYPWALKEISLPSVSEWAVLEIWKPVEIKKNRNNFNSKHGCSAISFFIVVTPTGRTHDSTSWNCAKAFPPRLVGTDKNKTCEERKDNKTFISSLEEFYGEGCPQKETEERAKKKKKEREGRRGEEGRREEEEEGEEEEEKRYTFALGGDKAYPQVLLPKGWSLYVTSTAGEKEAEKEANEGREKTTEEMRANGMEIPVFFRDGEKDDEKKRNMVPEIARPRGVVERVIGAMKRFMILLKRGQETRGKKNSFIRNHHTTLSQQTIETPS